MARFVWRRERPRRSSAAEQRDERAAPHSMTSSARARSVGGISRPSGIAPLTYQRDSCPLPAGERRGQEAAAGSPDPPVGLLVSLSPQSK
jgi:hypothetical protein